MTKFISRHFNSSKWTQASMFVCFTILIATCETRLVSKQETKNVFFRWQEYVSCNLLNAVLLHMFEAHEEMNKISENWWTGLLAVANINTCVLQVELVLIWTAVNDLLCFWGAPLILWNHTIDLFALQCETLCTMGAFYKAWLMSHIHLKVMKTKKKWSQVFAQLQDIQYTKYPNLTR